LGGTWGNPTDCLCGVLCGVTGLARARGSPLRVCAASRLSLACFDTRKSGHCQASNQKPSPVSAGAFSLAFDARSSADPAFSILYPDIFAVCRMLLTQAPKSWPGRATPPVRNGAAPALSGYLRRPASLSRRKDANHGPLVASGATRQIVRWLSTPKP